MKRSMLLALICAVLPLSASTAADNLVLQAEESSLDPERVEIVEQGSFKSGRGVALKADVKSFAASPDASPDLIFKVKGLKSGRYVFSTHAAVDATGREVMAKAKTKYDSMFMRIAVGNGRATRRVVFVPWSAPESCTQTTGKFYLTGEEQQIRISLPAHVRLDYLAISPYVPPKVPQAAAEYRPKVTPPASRPSLWVNEQSLPRVRANLTKGENAQVWAKVQQAAAKEYSFEPSPGTAVEYDADLETTAVYKAFVYLMMEDSKSGRQAIELMRDYLATVEFGNILDITREIGRAIYAGARVYDWCYPLMTDAERESIRKNLMRLADDMEIGWPPFKTGVVNGHGSEAQVHCHLLSMAIALYDEDPVPYQYCAYRILEELVPMRNFEYQSPRHNQGIGYGIYRFGWDMHAAWLFYRMTGRKIFDRNLENVHKYWLYMRLPNGESLPDGDGNADGRRANLGQTALLTSAYAQDPIMKADFLRQGGLPNDPILVLLVNDPELDATDEFSSLPLTLDFGPILGGMVARTGWNFGKDSTDAIVAMSGGGYHFANHQHADAGSFQVYYCGNQIVDLGQYTFYGTPYDMNFNKRSLAHSMMLVYDPDEPFGNRLNDGGTRFGFSSPGSVKAVTSNPVYANGTVVSTNFGPDSQQPLFSYFSVDLSSAYSTKVRSFVRTFCFLNLKNEHSPAALIVLDNIETSGADVTKYWQVNTLNPPAKTEDGLLLTSTVPGKTGIVNLQMLRPAPGARKTQIVSGKDANSVFGNPLTPPKPDAPQAKGHRVMFSPATQRDADVFLTVMTMSDRQQTSSSVLLDETSNSFILTLADRTVVLSKSGTLLKDDVAFEVRGTDQRNVVLTGLAPGTWNVRNHDGPGQHNARVLAKKNTAYFRLPPGRYVAQSKP